MLQRTDCQPCAGCCCEWEAGSSFPFHVSMTDFDSTDFSLPLDLPNPDKFPAIGFPPGVSEYPHVGIAGVRPRITREFPRGYSTDGRRARPSEAVTRRRPMRNVFPAAASR